MTEATVAKVASPMIEQGDPAADGRAFRRCLGQFPTGVAVVTTCHEEQIAGMAVNSFAAVSLDPPLVLWSIRRESSNAPAFLGASHFAVNVLSADQVETSQLFGASHPERFSRVPWEPARQGAPLLNGAIAHLECKTEVIYEGGDHLILVGRVERYARFEGEPLLFAQGRYGISLEHPALETPVPTAPRPEDAPPTAFWFSRRLRTATQKLSDDFQTHREALGLTLSQSRVLAHLGEGPCRIEQLQQSTYLGDGATEDALQELLRKGYVTHDISALINLTESGRAKIEQLSASLQAFTQERLKNVSDSDLAAFHRVLDVLSNGD